MKVPFYPIIPALLAASIGFAGTNAKANCFYSETEAFAPDSVSEDIAATGAKNLRNALKGKPDGYYRQGRIYFKGQTGEVDYDQALSCFQMASDQGYALADLFIGLTQSKLGDGPAAIAALTRAAEAGNEKAQQTLAFGHLRGSFGDASDPKLGFKETMAIAETGDARARYYVATALARGTGTKMDPVASFELMKGLAEEGNAAAMEQVGRAYTVGLGVKPNLEIAKKWYRAAIDADRTRAEIGLGTALYKNRELTKGLAAFERAVAAGVKDADYQLARAHSDRRFGRKSKQMTGWAKLTELSNAGHVGASQTILSTLGRGKGRPANVSFIRNQLMEAAQNGDGRSAAALAKFYRERPDLTRGARAKRQEVLKEFGPIMSDADRAIEAIRDTARANPANAWGGMYRVLKTAEGSAYTRAFSEIRRVSRNGFIYAVQREMNAMGISNAKARGIMTRRTIKDFFRLCRAAGRLDTCKHAPLSSDTARIVVGELAKRK